MPNTMIDKIKILIVKVKKKIFYNHCYKNMESLAVATFGMCSGAFAENYRKDNCYDCPYFTDIYGYKERGDNENV